jgi:hypothetical protein
VHELRRGQGAERDRRRVSAGTVARDGQAVHAERGRREDRGVTADLGEPRPRQDGLVWVERRPVHDVVIRRLHRQGQSREDVGQEIDPQILNRRHRARRAEGQGPERDEDLAEVGRQEEPQRLADVRVDRAALLDGAHDRREVVVHQHDVGDVARDVRAAGTHRDPDVGRAQRRGVVDPVAGHRDHVAARLQRAHDLVLVRRRHPREDVDLGDQGHQGRRIEPRELRGLDDSRAAPPGGIEVAVDRRRRARLITR